MKERIKIYRAMSPEEANKTRAQPSFRGKNKWFSPSLSHIRERVQDGCFNNAGFKKKRYAHILEFEIWAEDVRHFVECGKNELMLNVRKSRLVNWCKISHIQEERDG